MKFLFSTILPFLLLFPQVTFAQDSIPEPEMLNFFLDCDYCDFNFIREELPFVAFVREPAKADVHILVSDSRTGSGGRKFFLNFIGLKNFKDVNHNYEVIVSQSDTEDDERKAILKKLKLGILAYYSGTPFIDNLNVDIEEATNRKAESMVIDRWNNWIFRLSSGAFFNKEESQNDFSINGSLSASRITEKWKTQFGASYERESEVFLDEGERIENIQNSKSLNANIVRSLTEKWSAGLFGGYNSQTFMNIKNNIIIGTGVQYNFFPWKECNRRAFSLGYVIGADGYEYNQETIYDKTREVHMAEMLLLDLNLIQPWGEIRFEVEGRHYFHDFSKSRLSAQADFSVRLTRNLEVYCDIESQLIHDQLYLPKGDASLEDILLRRRKLATTYEIGGRLGFRFTFGSIFNNVVNERFNIEGD
jgi:hypothetical protein